MPPTVKVKYPESFVPPTVQLLQALEDPLPVQLMPKHIPPSSMTEEDTSSEQIM